MIPISTNMPRLTAPVATNAFWSATTARQGDAPYQPTEYESANVIVNCPR